MRSNTAKQTLASKLAAHEPRRFRDRSWLSRAAVALVLRGGGEVLLVERARRRGDRWSGHLAFPGGIALATDVDLRATAIRESREEAGLDLERDAECLGRLSDVLTLGHTRRPLAVAPFVFWTSSDAPLVLGAELEQALFLPLAEFAVAQRRSSRPRRMLGWVHPRAGHAIGAQSLWGLSLMMLDELADVLAE